MVLQIDEHRAGRLEHMTADRLMARLNWDDLNLIRTVADHPSIRRAAAFAGVSPNTVRARLQRIEHRVGTVFFVREPKGLSATPEGSVVAELARKMGRIGEELPHGLGNRSVVRAGEFRICVSEGIGSIWLTPRLGLLRDALPHLTLVIDCDMDQTGIDLSGYDLAIGFQRPASKDAVVSRLATVHVMPFASPGYLEKHGAPESIDDLFGHSIVHQVARGVDHDAIRLFMGDVQTDNLIGLRVSSSYALFGAVAKGLGIGAMPTYIRGVYQGIVPLDVSILMRFPLWLSYREAARDSKPLKTAISCLRSCFDPARYPWFAERFVHPRDFGMRSLVAELEAQSDQQIDAPV